MKYFSHYIWESGSEEKANPVSLVLQQVKYRGKHLLFACICEAEKGCEEAGYVSGYVTACLVEWFHKQYLKQWYDQSVGERLRRAVVKEMEKIDGELESYADEHHICVKYHILGMLMCEHDFVCIAKGEPKGYLFNRRFNRKQRLVLTDRLFEGNNMHADGLKTVCGCLQKGVAMILCNKEFDGQIKAEEMTEVLSEPCEQEGQIEKRLEELQKENHFRGGAEYGAAVYVRIG